MLKDRVLRLLVLVGTVLMILVIFLSWRQAQLAASGLGEMVTVWAPARDLPAATGIDPGGLVAMQVPAAFVLPGMVTDRESVAGWISPVPITAGQPLVQYALLQPDLGDPELRRFDVTADAKATVVLPAALHPGDRVDIIVASESAGGLPEARARMRDVPVLYAGSGEERTVGLAISLEQAEELTFYLNFAREVRILRRGPVGRAAE